MHCKWSNWFNNKSIFWDNSNSSQFQFHSITQWGMWNNPHAVACFLFVRILWTLSLHVYSFIVWISYDDSAQWQLVILELHVFSWKNKNTVYVISFKVSSRLCSIVLVGKQIKHFRVLGLSKMLLEYPIWTGHFSRSLEETQTTGFFHSFFIFD